MKRTVMIVMLVVVVAISAGVADEVAKGQGAPMAASQPAVQPTTPSAWQPVVEVAFVLDTTGSMSSLIAGAKAKIWYIANQIVLGEPTPRVRMALAPYRDKGDAYVTKVFDLTDNIDQVYADLMSFTAEGGGDTPENVNQGLYDAVHKLKWSDDPKTLKIIFLVGDCPPHNEYTDVPTYDKIAKAAIAKGININTILCGTNAEARKVWRAVASIADGRHMAIAADGGVKEIPTPYDDELAGLNKELLGTAVVFGRRETRRAQSKLNAAAGSMSKGSAAARAGFAADSSIVAANDLLVAVGAGDVKLAEVDVEDLPEAMRVMDADERGKYVAAQQAVRKKVNAKIKDLSAKRNAYIRQQQAADKGGKAGFDLHVVQTLQAQAAAKGISYKNGE